MQLEDLLALLPHGESIDLDWKRTFPLGYFDKSDRSKYDSARAEVIKDVASLANAASEKVGYLVYGIADQNGQRVVWPEVRTQSVDDAVLAQFLARYLDPAPSFEYAEFQHGGQLVGLLRAHRVMPYPHVVRESLGGAIHKGQVYVRKNSRTEIALHADLKHMMAGLKPMTFQMSSPKLEEIALRLRGHGLEISWVPDYNLDEALLDGREHVYYPGTRRYIVSPTGNPAGMFQQQFLMRRRPSSPSS